MRPEQVLDMRADLLARMSQAPFQAYLGAMLSTNHLDGKLGKFEVDHNGRVWEPISAMIFPTRELWLAYAGAEEERRYSKKTASKRVVERGDWGRWHSSRHP